MVRLAAQQPPPQQEQPRAKKRPSKPLPPKLQALKKPPPKRRGAAQRGADQALAKAVQKAVGAKEKGLAAEPEKLEGPVSEDDNRGGGSDDIGDVSWVVPTVTLRFPSNIPELPGHSWWDAIAMATPIAHKGATAGAQVLAMIVLDLVMRADLVVDAWAYFRDEQTKTIKYEPLLRPEDKPALELNRDVMARYRPALRKLYYDPSRYRSYLEQLGITYPTLQAAGTSP